MTTATGFDDCAEPYPPAPNDYQQLETDDEIDDGMLALAEDPRTAREFIKDHFRSAYKLLRHQYESEPEGYLLNEAMQLCLEIIELFD